MSIDVGVKEAADALAELRTEPPERVADLLVERLVPAPDDDVAVLLCRRAGSQGPASRTGST